MSVDAYRTESPLRTGQLTEMVLRHYGAVEGDNTRKYITLTQVRAATGFGDPNTADVMVMGNWPSSGNKLEGFEVKVSRSDWLNEVKAGPAKSEPYRKYCDRFWLVIADESFVKDGELPRDWGMMAAADGKLKVVKKAPFLATEPLSNTFVASLLRADASESIPFDVHNDKIKDAHRDAEAAAKAKYGQLMDYVRFLNREFGIKLEKSRWSDQWHAHIAKGSYSTDLDRERLAELFRKALSENLDELHWKFRSMEQTAKDILELTGAEPGKAGDAS